MATNDPIINWIISALTTPETDIYLWKLIQQSKDPDLEPFTSPRLDLGKHPVLGQDWAFALTDVKVDGISNVEIPKPGGKPDVEVTGSTVLFTAVRPNTESPPPGVPASLLANSGLEITPPGDRPIPGKSSVTVDKAKLIGVFDATSDTGQVDATVVLKFTSLAIEAQTGANITTTIDIDSVFKGFINKVMNKPDTQLKILAELSKQLQSKQVLDGVSSAATKAARDAIKKLVG